jgi:hypothetical protein
MVWGAHYTLGARYLYIKRNVKKVLGARYLPENTVLTERELTYNVKFYHDVCKHCFCKYFCNH